MGLSEREYMGSPVPPAISNFTVGLVVITLVCVFFIFQRNASVSTLQFSNGPMDGDFEEQMIQFDPTYKRHERLARISPIDLNTASYEDVRLLPRISNTVAHGIISGRPFFTIEQLDDVFGIGPKTVELYRPHVTINEHSLRRVFQTQYDDHKSLNHDAQAENPESK